MEESPVGFDAEGDVAELEDLIEGEGQCEEGGREEVEGEVEGGHGEEKDIREEDKDVMKRYDAFPAETRQESGAFVFLVLREGPKVLHDEIGEGKEGQRNVEGEE